MPKKSIIVVSKWLPSGSDVTIVVVVTMVTTPVFQRRKMLRNTWQYLRKEQDQSPSGQPSAVGPDDGKQSHS